MVEILFAVGLLAALVLPSEVLSWPSWLGLDADGGAQVEPARPDPWRRPGWNDADEPLQMSLHGGLFTASFIRRRLDALMEELARLDRDPDVFAKWFHTSAARSAYEALLVEATKATEDSWGSVGEILDAELMGSSTGPCEELEL